MGATGTGLSFIAQEGKQDVTELLNQISKFKTELVSRRDQLTAVAEDLETLEIRINELKIIVEKGQTLREELSKLQFRRDENIVEEEIQILRAISTVENDLTISQLCQRLSDNHDVWELLKALYKKGHLEITLRHRDNRY